MIKDVIAGAGRNWSFLLLLSKYFMESHGSEHTGFSVVRCLWSSVCQSASWCEHIASVPQYRCPCNAGVCTLHRALLYSWAVSSQPAYQHSPLWTVYTSSLTSSLSQIPLRIHEKHPSFTSCCYRQTFVLNVEHLYRIRKSRWADIS